MIDNALYQTKGNIIIHSPYPIGAVKIFFNDPSITYANIGKLGITQRSYKNTKDGYILKIFNASGRYSFEIKSQAKIKSIKEKIHISIE